MRKLEGISLVPEINYWRANDPGQTRSMIFAARQAQAEFRRQYGPDHRADLDLIFANPNGIPSVLIQSRLRCRHYAGD